MATCIGVSSRAVLASIVSVLLAKPHPSPRYSSHQVNFTDPTFRPDSLERVGSLTKAAQTTRVVAGLSSEGYVHMHSTLLYIPTQFQSGREGLSQGLRTHPIVSHSSCMNESGNRISASLAC